MDVTFLTPLGGLFVLTALVPLTMALARRRRMQAIRTVLHATAPPPRSWLPALAALTAAPMLLGVAATQPVVETARTQPERTDAQAYVVLDDSRSMLASSSPNALTRFQRARRFALELRGELPGLPLGVASLTDRVLPHLFPTTDTRVFTATVTNAVDVEQPPPSSFYFTQATSFDALAEVPDLNYFPSAAKKRVLVVLSDGETRSPTDALAHAFRQRPRIAILFVRFWKPDERIYETGTPEGGYRPDPGSGAELARSASLVGGRVFSEDQVAAVAAAVRRAIGDGPTVERRHESGRLALMPYLTLCALLPLLVVLASRNLWWRGLPRPRPRARRARKRAHEDAKVSEPRGVAQPG